MKKSSIFLPAFALIFSISLLSSCSGSAQQSAPAPANSVSVSEQAAPETPAKKTDYQDVDAAAFKTLLQKNPEAVILDVRTPAEFAQSNIEGAINIDIRSINFQEQINSMDKDKTYLVYCRTGRRSSAACMMMQNAGFNSVYNLQGGIVTWK